ncbi:unnamed protein product [Mucor hiemalis]
MANFGPFPIGTREQHFGADPLENYGGFSQLKYSAGAKFPSELVEGGFVGWNMVSSVNHTVGPIDFRHIRWKDNAIPFGWSIEQYQAWGRGILIVNQPAKVFMQISGVSEFYINGEKPYSGDCYGYNTTTHIVYLEKGKYVIDVRLVHDIRVFGGGKSPPQCQFHVHIEQTQNDDLLVYPEDSAVITPSMPKATYDTKCELLMPDYLKDIGFAGSCGSVSVQNIGDDSMEVTSITLCIVDDRSLQGKKIQGGGGGLFVEYKTEILNNHTIIVPGQTRPFGFQFQKEWGSLPSAEILRFWVRIGLAIKDDDDMTEKKEFAIRASSNVKCVDWIKSAFRFTFLDFDNTVQYAMAKRPRTLNRDHDKPIIVALHGAGVEADSEFWINSIPPQKSSWVIFPTGRTPWGYDWHGPSTNNVFKTLDGLCVIQELLPPHFECFDSAGGDWVNVSAPHETHKSLKLDDDREWVIGNKDRLILLGHSNGGQGVWHLTTHYPDKITAVVPAAGYVKIQDYASFANWVSGSYSDPLLRGVLESSIAEFNNDLHLSNMVNIPTLPRVGTEDDNVPPLHTRKYVRILNGLLKNALAIKSSEVTGQGHWWDTVFTDKSVQDFLNKYGEQKMEKVNRQNNEFCITLLNPAGIGSVNGIQVEQMTIPFRLGKIKGIEITDNSKQILTLKTTNISSFRFTEFFKGCNKLIVDGDKFSHLEKIHTSKGGVTLTLDKKSKRWKLEQVKSAERCSSNYGPIHRMYESKTALTIIIPPNKDYYEHIALQIAHDWYLYGRGDTVIVKTNDKSLNFGGGGGGYKIYLGLPTDNKLIDQVIADKPCGIEFEKASGLNVIDIKVGDKLYKEAGTGILFMQPCSNGGMAIIISGVDLTGFDLAWRLLPKRTGMMVPEWSMCMDYCTSPDMY